MVKKLTALFAALAVMLSLLSGCGESAGGVRVIDELGVKHLAVYCREGDTLAEKVNDAMNTLAADGTLSTTAQKWLGSDVITLKGTESEPDEDETEEEEAALRTLVVGVEADSAPFADEDENGEWVGMSVDIAYALGGVLGWDVRIQPVTCLDLSAQLASGNIDCAVGFPVEIAASGMSAGDSYMQSRVLLVSLADSEYSSYRSLEGARIACRSADTYSVQLAQGSEDLNKYAQFLWKCSDVAACMNSFTSGVSSAAVMDEYVLSAAINSL